ncbi:MAG: DinB family protein [Chthonomonas sp.]|nr:DinB family protein [Chthonomonas sp.]
MDRIEHCKHEAVANMEFFLRNFAHVPDDKLTWTPTANSKSALRIGAHVAIHTSVFAKMIRERSCPAPDNLESWLAKREAEETSITTREEMERVFRQGTTEVLEALDTLQPEEIATELDSGQGWTMPMTQVMGLAGWHATLHAGQIDYLQTCWNDQEIYVG